MTLLLHLSVNLLIVAAASRWTGEVLLVVPTRDGLAGIVAVAVLSAVIFGLANMFALRVQFFFPGLFALLVNAGLLLGAGWLAQRTGYGLAAADRVAVAWAALAHTGAHLAVQLLAEAGAFTRRGRPGAPGSVTGYTEY